MKTYLELKQKSENPQYLMVMLHGFGSNGADLISLAPYFQDLFPEIYFYSPDGLDECELGNCGYQWFSLQNRDNNSIKVELLKNINRVNQQIKSKLLEVGLDESKLILLGFSQGTMLALFMILSGNITASGAIGFSGKLIIPDNFNVIQIHTPICLIHGMRDEVVDYNELLAAKEFLDKNELDNSILSVPHLGHTIDLSGIEFAKNFIKSKIINKK